MERESQRVLRGTRLGRELCRKQQQKKVRDIPAQSHLWWKGHRLGALRQGGLKWGGFSQGRHR